MTTESYPFADTHAARMLDDAIKRYTASHPGGLRALATRLGMKQATVLSHMANGRMGIPLDRANQLAATLGMGASEFVTAVLQQRAPDVCELLVNQGESQVDDQSLAESIVRTVRATNGLTAEHARLVRAVLDDRGPMDRWAIGQEAELISTIREVRPLGLTEDEWRRIIRGVRQIISEMDLN